MLARLRDDLNYRAWWLLLTSPPEDIGERDAVADG
jgi:hypothetical protein